MKAILIRVFSGAFGVMAGVIAIYVPFSFIAMTMIEHESAKQYHGQACSPAFAPFRKGWGFSVNGSRAGLNSAIGFAKSPPFPEIRKGWATNRGPSYESHLDSRVQ